MRRRRDRSLREDELALWRHVARSVTPLPGRRLPGGEPEPPRPDADMPPATAAAALLPPGHGRPPSPKLPPLAPLDRRLRVALKRGTQTVDAKLDLHGLRQAEAHGALVAFLVRARARGARVVLVVTGKGGAPHHGDPFGERGVLRRLVPQWLCLPDLRSVVLGFEEAGREHGGEGALYVRLRRRRAGGERP